ncbi:MAG: hypothetical protein IT430_08990 [Phycisphaerales bacterium]|nr:hypothetical protein [Phycisphaerales bacterium]
MTPLVHRIADLMFPLEEFYADRGDALPRIEAVSAGDLPPPYRDLLVHERDMTTTLEEHFGEPVALRLLEVRRDGPWLRRQVVLVGSSSDRPVEFGAIRIDLGRFDSDAVRRIVDCRQPLGAILHDCGVEHACRPSAFFRFVSDAATRAAFELAGPTTLYGRHTLIHNQNDQTLAEVVEILPPIGKVHQA